MLFTSFEFLVLFLPLVLVVALRLRGQPLLRWITLASVVFYAFAGHWWFVIPMLLTTTIDYAVALAISRETRARRRAWLLGVSLAGNLGMLAYFKYSGLLVRTAEQALAAVGLESGERAFGWFEVVLPAGISFYTFQTLSYIVDVWRGQAPAERNFICFAAFVSFFPHLVAGPLTRHHQLIPGLARIASTGIDPRWRAGILLFSIGLVKKVLIADRLGNLVDPILAGSHDLDLARAWLALLGYALQIYFDFSGYSDMAIGLGRLFGIELPQNFNSPYKAESPSDFWRRWHMTLSLWLRDYLYIPLGGNRCSPARHRFNLMATMVLGGLWHGASWTFAGWGAWHGVLLVTHQALPGWDRSLSVFWRRNVTFLLVTLGWVLFRSQGFAQASGWFAGLAGAHGVAGSWTVDLTALLGLVVTGLLIARACPNSLELPLECLGPVPQVGLGLTTAVALVLMNYGSKFLYFQF
ncbi:MAG TPA: MBOAT family O-acyltransferase [Methylomirabilota bacterium]|nr:MBOAT family O-acyltransferase [Methylomirabilota bacterium]